MIQAGLNFLTTKRRKKKFQFLPKNGMRDKNHKNNLLLKENWHVSFEICQWILQSWNWIHFFWYIKNKILFHLYFYHFLAFKKFYRIPSCHCQYPPLAEALYKESQMAHWNIQQRLAKSSHPDQEWIQKTKICCLVRFWEMDQVKYFSTLPHRYTNIYDKNLIYVCKNLKMYTLINTHVLTCKL